MSLTVTNSTRSHRLPLCSIIHLLFQALLPSRSPWKISINTANLSSLLLMKYIENFTISWRLGQSSPPRHWQCLCYGQCPSHPAGQQRCWNCRELDCNIMSCPKPKDPSRVAANRKLSYHKKQQAQEANKEAKNTPKTSKPVTFAWRLPEPHENNKHIIHGRSHIYNPEKPGWDEDENPPNGLATSKPLPSPTPTEDKDDGAIQISDLSTTDLAITKIQLDLASLSYTVHNLWSIAFHTLKFYSLWFLFQFTQFFIHTTTLIFFALL